MKCLEDFPPEILMKIFEFVPNKEPLKYTCLKFCAVVSHIEIKKLKLIIKDDNINDYKIILRSHKLFDEVELQLWNYDEFNMLRVSQILIKFQKTLKKISFKYSAIKENCLIKLLNFLPGLQEIIIDASLINPSSNCSQQLSSLKHVKTFISKVEAAKILLELPNDTITKLSFKSIFRDLPSEDFLMEIFNKQRNIEDLLIDPEKLSTNVILPKLRKLELRSPYNCEKILQNNSNLTTFIVYDFLDEEIFEKICHINSLQTLSIHNPKNMNSLKSLNNLTSLKHLIIRIDDGTYLKAFENVILPNLEKFEVNSSGITDYSTFAENFSEHFPRVYHLKIDVIPMKTFLRLLENQSLRFLDVNRVCTRNNEIDIQCNTSLKELRLHRDISNFLFDIIIFLPNLEKLFLKDNLINNVTSMKMILTTCKKLTHLTCLGQTWFSNPFNSILNLLKENGRNLSHFHYEFHVARKDCVIDIEKFKNSFDHQFQFIYAEKNKALIMRNDKWE